MFLVTTANERYWPTEGPVLFLGEWCKLYGRKDVWSAFSHEVLPYRWHDRDRFHRDCEYVDALYERALAQLAKQLNEFHGVSWSGRYWRIIAGGWLRVFIDSLFDRYLSIREAGDSGLVTNTIICSTAPVTPPDIPSFAFDDYNQYLYSRCIEELSPFPFEREAVEPVHQYGSGPVATRGARAELGRHLRKSAGVLIRQSLATLATGVYPRVAGRIRHNPVVVLGTTYLRPAAQLQLQASLGQVPFVYHGWRFTNPARSAVEPPDRVGRKRIEPALGNSEFERLLARFIRDEIPIAYVEGYQRLRAAALEAAPKACDVILTAYTINYRTTSEFWVAEQVETRGTKLALVQHGGGYGSSRNLSMERHFLGICDRYYTWGARLDDRSVPMPSFRLTEAKRAIRAPVKQGPILWIATTFPRYRTFMDSAGGGPPMLDYIADQFAFLRSVDEPVRDLLVWRYFNDLWSERARMVDAFPMLRVQKGRKNQLGRRSDFARQVGKSRLTIHTLNSTTYLETMAANFPTIAYWNPKHDEVREDVRPAFERLRDAGILHYRPEEAASHVNSISEDPSRWWSRSDVQLARREFCAQLALTDPAWMSTWRRELSRLIRSSDA